LTKAILAGFGAITIGLVIAIAVLRAGYGGHAGAEARLAIAQTLITGTVGIVPASDAAILGLVTDERAAGIAKILAGAADADVEPIAEKPVIAVGHRRAAFSGAAIGRLITHLVFRARRETRLAAAVAAALLTIAIDAIIAGAVGSARGVKGGIAREGQPVEDDAIFAHP
jgi:hypothetical protein